MIRSLEESHRQMKTSLPECNPDLQQMLRDWGLEEEGEGLRDQVVYTEYHPVEKLTNGLVIKW